jgi:prepilin-type N-terminal cleavage/methylation domain-containing protein/prepilin-type processing-associated H-X9-DG protein
MRSLSRRPFAKLKRSAGFTLVELLVVIGIIALLISILLPSLNAARRAADRTKCLSALRQIGNGYYMYANDNKGYFPRVVYRWWTPAGTVREKTWYDFVSKYVTGDKRELNATGSQAISVEPQISSPDIMNGNNVLWGCPTFTRFYKANYTATTYSASTLVNGYTMNAFPFGPNDTRPADPAAPSSGTVNSMKRTDTYASAAAAVVPGNKTFFKQTQYSRPSERALVFDNVHRLPMFSAALQSGWSYEPDTNTPWITTPDALYFSPDFLRHPPKVINNLKPTVKSLNMLFCDGHADTVSAREAYRAVRFH